MSAGPVATGPAQHRCHHTAEGAGVIATCPLERRFPHSRAAGHDVTKRYCDEPLVRFREPLSPDGRPTANVSIETDQGMINLTALGLQIDGFMLVTKS